MVRDQLLKKRKTLEKLQNQDKKVERTAHMSDKEVALLQDSASKDRLKAE